MNKIVLCFTLMQGMHAGTFDNTTTANDHYSEFDLWTRDLSILHPFLIYFLFKIFRILKHDGPVKDDKDDDWIIVDDEFPDELKSNIFMYLNSDQVFDICHGNRAHLTLLFYDSFIKKQNSIMDFIKLQHCTFNETILIQKSVENNNFSKLVAEWIDQERIKASENLLYLSLKYSRNDIFKSVYHKLDSISKNITKKVLDLTWNYRKTTQRLEILEKYVKNVNLKIELLKDAIESKEHGLIVNIVSILQSSREELNMLGEVIASSPDEIFFFLDSQKSINLGDKRLIYDIALDHKNFRITERLTQEGIYPEKRHLISACHSGNLEAVKYLTLKEKIRANTEALRYAIVSGNLKLVRFMVETLSVRPQMFALELSCLYGGVGIYDYISKILQHKVSPSCLDAATLGGNFVIAKKLIRPDISDPETRQHLLSEGRIVAPDSLTVTMLSYLEENNLFTSRFKIPGKEEDYHGLKEIYELFFRRGLISSPASGEKMIRNVKIFKLIKYRSS